MSYNNLSCSPDLLYKVQLYSSILLACPLPNHFINYTLKTKTRPNYFLNSLHDIKDILGTTLQHEILTSFPTFRWKGMKNIQYSILN